MSEKLQSHSEKEITPEHIEIERKKQLERLNESLETKAEQSPEKSAESAREILKEVVNEQEKVDKEATHAKVEKPHKKLARNTKSLDSSFKVVMKDARQGMSAPSRNFSKLIHNKAIEKTSEAVGSTVARPNAILFGSLTSLILTAGLYFWARYVGYPLSGFETIGAFIIGWILGITFDFTRIMITGKQR